MKRLSSRTREALADGALFVGACAVALAAALVVGELWLRLAHGNVPPGPPESWADHDPVRGWAMKPGRYAYFDVQAARRADVFVNELGLRQDRLEREPPPGVTRVAVVGDSFIFGPPVHQHETIPAQLQALAGSGYEIVNVSAPGYGTGQELRLLQALHERGVRVGPRTVLAFFTNDLQDNLALDYSTLRRNPRQPRFFFDDKGVLRQDEVAPPKVRRHNGGPEVLHSLMFPRFVRYQAEVVAVTHPKLLDALERAGLAPSLPRTPGIVAGWYGAGWEARWQLTERLLEHTVEWLRREERSDVAIAFVPSPFQMPGAFRIALEASEESDPRYAEFLSDSDRPQRLVGALAARMGVPFVDLTPAVREAGARELLYFPREGHFNEAGCRLVARVLHERLLRDGTPHVHGGT